MFKRFLATCGVLFLALATPGMARDFNAGFIEVDEIRIGGALSSLELIAAPPFLIPELSSFGKARLDAVKFNILFTSPDLGVFDWLGSPRPELGLIVNAAGFEHVVHAGLRWHAPLGDTFFLEAGLGLGVTTAYTNNAPPGYREVGCSVLFNWSYGAGVNLTDKMTLSAEWTHVSSAHLCQPNNGVNHVGLSLGFKF